MSLVVVCGGSGMVGRKLIGILEKTARPYAVVGRDASRLRGGFPRAERCESWDQFSKNNAADIATIVNLAGAGVTDKRWSPAYKEVMNESRLKSTASCAEVCVANPTIYLLSASSIHAYGVYPGDHAPFTDADRDRRVGTCYLQQLIDAWEAATTPATDAGCRVTLLRIGFVLSAEGGGLSSLAAPFRFFVGGRHGSGEQVISWISLLDLAGAIAFLIDHPDINGPVNVVAPNACTNLGFARALGLAMGRPAVVPLPSFLTRLLIGEAADELVLGGQRVAPAKLLEAGFDFTDTQIGDCLRGLFQKPT